MLWDNVLAGVCFDHHGLAGLAAHAAAVLHRLHRGCACHGGSTTSDHILPANVGLCSPGGNEDSDYEALIVLRRQVLFRGDALLDSELADLWVERRIAQYRGGQLYHRVQFLLGQLPRHHGFGDCLLDLRHHLWIAGSEVLDLHLYHLRRDWLLWVHLPGHRHTSGALGLAAGANRAAHLVGRYLPEAHLRGRTTGKRWHPARKAPTRSHDWRLRCGRHKPLQDGRERDLCSPRRCLRLTVTLVICHGSTGHGYPLSCVMSTSTVARRLDTSLANRCTSTISWL